MGRMCSLRRNSVLLSPAFRFGNIVTNVLSLSFQKSNRDTRLSAQANAHIPSTCVWKNCGSPSARSMKRCSASVSKPSRCSWRSQSRAFALSKPYETAAIAFRHSSRSTASSELRGRSFPSNNGSVGRIVSPAFEASSSDRSLISRVAIEVTESTNTSGARMKDGLVTRGLCVPLSEVVGEHRDCQTDDAIQCRADSRDYFPNQTPCASEHLYRADY